MTFKEFSRAIKKDSRLMELLDHCHPECGTMSDEDTQEMIDRAAVCNKWENDNQLEGN